MIITAKFASVCPCCAKSITIGSKVEWSRGSKAVHVACAGKPATTTSYRPAYARRGSGAGSAASVAGYSSYCTDRPGCRCYDCAS